MISDMAEITLVPKPLRVLVSEGNSTSAREAITILGLSGHHVEVCDPSRIASRGSRDWSGRFIAARGCGTIRPGFWPSSKDCSRPESSTCCCRRMNRGFCLRGVRERLSDSVGLALPDFASYRVAHSKAGFSRLLDQLGLPQPPTRIVKSETELRAAMRFPSVVKTSVGTASRGIWFVRNEDELESVLRDLSAQGLSASERRSPTKCWCRILSRASPARRKRCFATADCSAFTAIGKSLPAPVAAKRSSKARAAPTCAPVWPRSESISPGTAPCRSITSWPMHATPLLIDCNPRLVEPMSAYLAGIDLVGLLLAVSLGQTPEPVPASRDGVRTHLAMQALLGCASRGGSRREIWCVSVGSLRPAAALTPIAPRN